jgi:NTE family protein
MQHYRANQFIALGLMPVYSFKKQIHAKLEAYAFFPVQEILVDQDNEAYLGGYFKTMKPMINATLNLVTVAGPISLNLGYIAEEQNPWLIQLSFGYLLFNKKSADE